MKKIIFILVLFLSTLTYAKKVSIIIAIGDYPKNSGWSDISSGEDIPLIKNTLLGQGFLEENIYIIKDKKATKKGILSLMSKVRSTLKEDDILMIHVSSHGQQIFDQNGDEIDGLDEAIVPYDADAYYEEGGYQGQNHIRDDELENVFNLFRNTLGEDGQLFVTFDSCHSGSATRGRGVPRGGKPIFTPKNWEPTKNNKAKGYEIPKIQLAKNTAPFIYISGASANELNYEYEGNGALSYALSKAFNELGEDFTYKQLFAKISSIMAGIANKQTPTIEGDINFKIFSGDYVKIQPSFTLNQIVNNKEIIINGGKINRLFKGSIVSITLSTAVEEEGNSITKGIITESKNLTSRIKLDLPLPNKNFKDYAVFIDEYAFDEIKVNVWLDNPLSEIEKESIRTKFKNEKFVSFIKDSAKSKIYISKGRFGYSLNSFSNNEPLSENLSLEELDKNLFTYAQGNYLKAIHMDNKDYQLEFELLKMVDGNIAENNGVMPKFNTNGDIGILRIHNKGDKPLYFSIIEINTQGNYTPIIPSNLGENPCLFTKDELKLVPGKSVELTTCQLTFGPPYEKLILKGFASSTPINFNTLQSRGPSNPLEAIVKRSASRGSEPGKANVEGYSTEFVYEIVKE